MPTDPQITWTISLDQANLIMSIVSDQKFSLVADLIVTLRQQAATQLQQIQAQQSAQMAAQMPPPLPAPKGNGQDARE